MKPTCTTRTIKKRPSILLLTDHAIGEQAGPGFRIERTVRALESVGELRIIFLRLREWDFVWDRTNVQTMVTQRRMRLAGRFYDLLMGWPGDSRYVNSKALKSEVLKQLDDPPDLIWVFRARPYSLLTGLHNNCPVVVDFDDLYDHMFNQALHQPPTLGFDSNRVASFARRFIFRLESCRWNRWQKTIASQVSQVGVVSAADAKESDLPNAVSLPNGYLDPGNTHYSPPAECRLLMVGGYHYEPNAAAAALIATQVLPRVREVLPKAELHLVGRSSNTTRELSKLPGVHCHGSVESVDEWYRKSTVAMTMINSGAGSCIKVVEAMAHQVPIVSTPFGARGFNLTHTLHVMVANSAEEAAQQVITLYRQPQRAKEITENAYQHFKQHFDSAHCETAISMVAQNALSLTPLPSARVPPVC